MLSRGVIVEFLLCRTYPRLDNTIETFVDKVLRYVAQYYLPKGGEVFKTMRETQSMVFSKASEKAMIVIRIPCSRSVPRLVLYQHLW